jgi:hypothetical protein
MNAVPPSTAPTPTPPPSVVPILAIPFGVVPLEDAAERNAELAALFTGRSREDAGAQGGNPLCYRGRDDLLEWPEPPVRELAAAIMRGVCAVVGAVNELSAAQLQMLKLEARGWFTIVRPDGCVPAAHYPLTAWCAIYCVAAPAASTRRRDSGVLRLYESRPATMFPDASTAAMRIPYTPGHHGWRPVPGQLAVFPASLTHEIALLRADAPLLLVTLRVRFIAPNQQGIGRW